MVELLSDNVGWATRISGIVLLGRLAFLWLTAYPLLVIERQKTKALTQSLQLVNDLLADQEALIQKDRPQRPSPSQPPPPTPD